MKSRTAGDVFNMRTNTGNKKGFALIEVLIAVSILSIVLLSIFSAVSTTLHVLSGVRNSTRAMFIARSKLNELTMHRMRGTDISREEVKSYPGFTWSRETERYEHPLLGPLGAKKTEITVNWTDNGRERSYSITYIYPEK